MQFYQEINLKETPEISPYFILSKLYTQVHLALVEQQNLDKTVNIGVSFPQYIFKKENSKCISTLGKCIRLFSSNKESFLKLNLRNTLSRLTDYLDIKKIEIVPTASIKGYNVFTRKQVKGSPESLARRYTKRHSSISYEEALKLYSQNEKISLKLPFIQMKSYSSNNMFKLFIEKKDVDSPQRGTFSTYGLSDSSTVPIF